MRWNSVRVRLTLWNLLVVALVLVCFSAALSYFVRHSLAAAVDQELADRAHTFVEGWSHGASRRPSAAASPDTDPRFGSSEEGPASTARRSPSRMPPGLSGPDRVGYFRRARLLDREGRSMIPGSDDEPWDADTMELSLAGHEIYSTVRIENEEVRVYSAPLWGLTGVDGAVQVAHSLTEQKRLNEGLLRTLFALVPLTLLAAALGGAFLTDRALRPVRKITHAAAQIGAEDLSRRLEVTGKDELSDLAATFNGMIARLEEAFANLESAYEQQRRFVGDASHELRTPLTTIKANTSLALAGNSGVEDLREALQAADEAADTMTRIVQDLLLLARSDGGSLGLELRPTSLESVLERAIGVTRHWESAPIRLNLPREPIDVLADQHYLVRLVVNLLENASRHTPADGEIVVCARRAGDTVTVSVRDTGEGIPPEHLPHVCERFYRVEASRVRTRGGTGLGLAICRSIAQAHGGDLTIESEVGRGTVVTFTLRAAPTETPLRAREGERVMG